MKKVLVTGANGHVGYNLIKLLLEENYEVRAGVRDTSDEKKLEPLKKLGVNLIQANIMNKQQLLEASKGMDGVFHLAAVFTFNNHDVENKIIKPAIEGTTNMLEAAIENRIRKLVLTSSVVAVGGGRRDAPHDESHWNDETKIPYHIAKVRSEKKAWELAKYSDLRLVVVNPGVIIGPNYYRPTPSTEIIESILYNKYPGVPPITFPFVDVRDIARALLLVYENDSAQGRYIASGVSKSFSEIMDEIKEIRPTVKKPKLKMSAPALKYYAGITTFFRKLVGKSSDYSYQTAKEHTSDPGYYSDAKIEQLGWKKMDLQTSLKDMIEWIENHMNM